MKKDKKITVIAIVMTAGGIPLALIWASMMAIGGLVNSGVPAYFSSFIIAGAAGALVAMINGIMINRKSNANGAAAMKAQIVLAVLTAVLSLPGGVMFILMEWYFAAIPTLLFGFGLSAYYLLRVYDAYSDKKAQMK